MPARVKINADTRIDGVDSETDFITDAFYPE